jgi:hydroxyacylglutathione hydrolase
MLYDSTADVIRKALRGLGMAPSEAAATAGLPERDVIAASRGPVPPETLRALAPALRLSPDALAGLPDYEPLVCSLEGIRRLELPFDNETVNAWLLDNSAGGHLLVDAGDGPNDIRNALERLGISSVDVLITHEHGDHAGGLRGLGDMARGPGSARLKPGDRIRSGKLEVRVIDLPGHCPGAVGYVIEGLGTPVCATGDALFAGSIGGCAPGEPYRQALAALGSEVMTLAPGTILLPGHGPPSSVASESKSNAFLAGDA